MSDGTATRTPLQHAIVELDILFHAAENVLAPAEYDVFVAVAVSFVARRAAEVVDREWREAA